MTELYHPLTHAQRTQTLLPRNLLSHVLFIIARKQFKSSLTDKGITKTWYSWHWGISLKKNEITKFSGKQKELGKKILLSVVIQTQKGKHQMFFSHSQLLTAQHPAVRTYTKVTSGIRKEEREQAGWGHEPWGSHKEGTAWYKWSDWRNGKAAALMREEKGLKCRWNSEESSIIVRMLS